jgi:hypothetical protein
MLIKKVTMLLEKANISDREIARRQFLLKSYLAGYTPLKKIGANKCQTIN